MIERIRDFVDQSGSTAVLLREAARTSRRWQTYGARTAFSGALFGVLILGTWAAMNAPNIDRADMGWMGRTLFIGFSTALLMLATMLAPLVTSAAMIEESEDRTLEMLVLSKLTPARILVGKVLSRILALLTIVLGSFPVLAMVVTLGGVAPNQVVSVIIHTFVAVVLLGFLGAFFGLFTRSPLLAMLASVIYAGITSLFFPVGYVLLTSDPADASHFSLVSGAVATDMGALLSPLSWVPSLALMHVIGTRLFELQVSHADIREAFSPATWGTPRFLWACVVAFVLGLVVVVPSSVVSYTVHFADTDGWLGLVLSLGSTAFLWAWATLLLTLLTWLLLRVGVDVVDALDAVLGGRDQIKDAEKNVRVWGNPVAWREARPAAWSTNGLPLLMTWLLLLLGLMQTGGWMVPGGAIAIGALNILVGFAFTIWLASRSVGEERKNDSLRVLLTTTLSSWRIVAGKSAGVVVLTLPIFLLTWPFLAFGLPYVHAFDNEELGFAHWFVRGTLTWAWLIGVWAVLLQASFLLTLSLKRSRGAFAVVLVVLGVTLGVPTTLARLFPDSWLAIPARIVAPPLAGDAEIWHYLLSMSSLALLAVALFVVTSQGLRRWIIAALSALTLVSVAPSTAEAQQVKPQSGFLLLAEPFGDGVMRREQWASVRVRVVNEGPEAVGTVSITERLGADVIVFERPIALPEGARKDLTLLYRSIGGARTREVVLETPGRRAVSTVKLKRLGDTTTAIGIVGQNQLGLQLLREVPPGRIPQLIPLGNDTDPRTLQTVLLETAGMPKHHVAYAAFDQIVWPDFDPSSLEPAQSDALRHWVAGGGHLVVSVTDTVAAVRSHPMAELLPLELVRSEARENLGTSLTSLGAPAGAGLLAIGRSRELVDRSVFTVLETPEGEPVWVTSSYGLGAVTLLTVDLDSGPLKTADTRLLWTSLLHLDETANAERWTATRTLDDPSLATLHNVLGLGNPISSDEQAFLDLWDEPLRQWLSDIPGVAPLPLSWLLAFSLVYLFVIGPLDYTVLRLLKRRPWTWVTFPVTIVVFSTVALFGTARMKGDQAVHQIFEVVELLPGTGLTRGTTHSGVFATGNVDLALRHTASDSVSYRPDVYGYASVPTSNAGLGPGVYRWNQEIWTLGYGTSRWTRPSPDRIELSRASQGYNLHNDSSHSLTDLLIVFEGSTYELDDMEPGGTVAFDPSTHTRADTPSKLRRSILHHPMEGGGPVNPRHFDMVLTARANLDPTLELAGVNPTVNTQTFLRAPLRIPTRQPAATPTPQPSDGDR